MVVHAWWWLMIMRFQAWWYVSLLIPYMTLARVGSCMCNGTALYYVRPMAQHCTVQDPLSPKYYAIINGSGVCLKVVVMPDGRGTFQVVDDKNCWHVIPRVPLHPPHMLLLCGPCMHHAAWYL